MTRFILTIIISLGIFKSHCQNDKKEYSDLLKEIKVKHNYFYDIYSKVKSDKKDSIINVSRDYLIKTISKEVFPHWYGTPWDFNGTTRTPKKGKIACGYFITNILTDLNFNIPRVKWAQSASESFIKKLALKKDIRRFTNASVNDVKKYLKTSGNGVYLVGLDMHVGFIVVENDTIRFVHPTYYKPNIGVVSEKLDSWNPFRDSKYRVIGKLFSDTMIKNWIKKVRYN